jgi:hypothetical protein
MSHSMPPFRIPNPQAILSIFELQMLELRLGQFEAVQYLLPIEMKPHPKTLENVVHSAVDTPNKIAIRSVVQQRHIAKNFAVSIQRE